VVRVEGCVVSCFLCWRRRRWWLFSFFYSFFLIPRPPILFSHNTKVNRTNFDESKRERKLLLWMDHSGGARGEKLSCVVYSTLFKEQCQMISKICFACACIVHVFSSACFFNLVRRYLFYLLHYPSRLSIGIFCLFVFCRHLVLRSMDKEERTI